MKYGYRIAVGLVVVFIAASVGAAITGLRRGTKDYVVPYAAYSFMDKPVSLKVYEYTLEPELAHTPNVFVFRKNAIAEYDVAGIQPKTVHQWEKNILGCSRADWRSRYVEDQEITCLAYPLEITVNWVGGSQSSSAQKFNAYEQAYKAEQSSWAQGMPGRQGFVHFVILPDGSLVQVAQIFNDGSIILSAGPEANMGYIMWADGHVTKGRRPQDAPGAYLPENSENVPVPAGSYPIIVNDGAGQGKLAWATSNWRA